MNSQEYTFIRKYTLVAQTPLIHFQHKQSGAALRATEVKPKLDKYILSHYEKDTGKKIPSEWKIGNKNALQYKLQIRAISENEPIKVGDVEFDKKKGKNIKKYDIFYGNTNVKNEDKIKGVKRDVTLKFVCFIPELQAYIDKIIDDFFIVTNFGTMQSKGFGSFIVDRSDSPQLQYRYGYRYICNLLKSEFSAEKCYTFGYGTDDEFAFKKIKLIYTIMKTGVSVPKTESSFLFDYFSDKEVEFNNEKNWLRVKGFISEDDIAYDVDDDDYRYIRALLGITGALDYIHDEVKVSIKEKGEEIKRLSSPILFKIINGTVYAVAKRIDKRIYGKTFCFESPFGSGEITVPTQEEVGESFIDDFMKYSFIRIEKCKGKFGVIRNTNFREV